MSSILASSTRLQAAVKAVRAREIGGYIGSWSLGVTERFVGEGLAGVFRALIAPDSVERAMLVLLGRRRT